MSEEDARTVWVGNLDDRVTEEVLHELFLQAGPLHYVRHPKDKASGRKKNFAFVCFRHESSVPYAITLMGDIQLFGRNLRVQSRHLQELQAKGLRSYDHGGIHSIDPFEDQNSPAIVQEYSQQSPLMPHPNSGLLSKVPPHVLALAKQQMSRLNDLQPIPLSSNPSLNARLTPRADRFGSINYGRNNPNADVQSYQGYNNFHQNNRSRGSRHISNQAMQAMKSRIEDTVAQNSQMLATVQERQGRFNMNRRGAAGNNYDNRHQNRNTYNPNNRYQHDHNNFDNDNRYQRDYDNYNSDNRYQHDRGNHHRSGSREYRQQPYDRRESHHNRNHERHNSYDNHRRHNDRSGSSHRSSSSDHYERGYRNSSYDSRR